MGNNEKRYFCRECGKPMLLKYGGVVAAYHLCPDENCRCSMNITFDYWHGDRTSFSIVAVDRYQSYKAEGFTASEVVEGKVKESIDYGVNPPTGPRRFTLDQIVTILNIPVDEVEQLLKQHDIKPLDEYGPNWYSISSLGELGYKKDK